MVSVGAFRLNRSEDIERRENMLRKELKRFPGDAFPKTGRKVGRHAATTQRPVSILLQYISAVRCPKVKLANKDR